MQTTANRRQNGDNYKLETNWSQASQTKTWGQTEHSEPTIKGLSQLALSLSLSSAFLLEGPGHTTSPTLRIIHNCIIPNFTIPEIFLCPGIKPTCTIPEKHLSQGIRHTCTIPKNTPKSRNQTLLYHS